MDLRRPRTVLDTQILVRAFHTGKGATGGIIRALQQDRFRLVTSEPLLEELRRVFYRPEVQRIAPSRPIGVKRGLNERSGTPSPRSAGEKGRSALVTVPARAGPPLNAYAVCPVRRKAGPLQVLVCFGPQLISWK